MVSLLQVIWFSVVYAFSTIALVGSLDVRLALIIVIWLAVFAVLARKFLPRVRKAARESAEAASVVQGRFVDGYSNIQTLKLFGDQERDDARADAIGIRAHERDEARHGTAGEGKHGLGGSDISVCDRHASPRFGGSSID